MTGSCTVEKWTSYTGNALKPFPFQFDDSSFDRALSNCFLLLSLNFSRFFLVSFGCPWMISWLKSIKSIHIPQYFVIIDFVRFFKLINRLLSSNIDFIDLSISFPIIDFRLSERGITCSLCYWMLSSRARKDGLPSKPKSLNGMLLSQRKNMIAFCWECWQHFANIRDTCYILPECFISLSENLKANHSVGIVSHRPWCSCDSANRLWKELNLWSVFLVCFSQPFFSSHNFLSCQTQQTKRKRDYS